MKKISLVLICSFFIQITQAQQALPERVITTGVPFLMVAADARSAGLGDQGVATSADGFSQQWNAAKFAFAEKQQAVSLSYTPYLTGLVNDISLGQLTYYNRLNERSAFAGSLRYFSLGEINLTDANGTSTGAVAPNEFAIDGSYSLKLSEKFSMGIGARFINSALRIPDVNNDASAARTFAVDVSGFFQGEEVAYNDFNGRLRFGFNFQNLGPKINYDSTIADKNSNFLPANLKIGAGYDFAFDEYSKFTLSVEFAKLLVPTPQISNADDNFDYNSDGIIDGQDFSDSIRDYRNINWTEGIFKSFNDAPGGLAEEMREVTYSIGTEYAYQDSFAVRLGYFHESEVKGARQFFSLGAGFKYTAVKVDVSYLFNASNIKSPLENTLRFSLTIGFGDDYENY